MPWFHASDITEPQQASLTEDCKQTVHAGKHKHVGIGQFLIRVDVQDVLQAPHVKTVEFLFMLYKIGRASCRERV